MRMLAGFGWVVLAALAAFPTGAAKGSFVDLGTGVAVEGFTLVGDHLIYFDLEPGTWELRERDLTLSDERVLTTISYGDGTRIRGLVANEQWVVWSDDRSGEFDIYAVERSTGQSSRIVRQAGEDSDVHLHGDRIAFEAGTRLFTMTLPNGKPQALNVSGQALQPVISEDSIVYLRFEARETSVVSSAPGRADVTLEKTRGSYPKFLRADTGALAWLTSVLWNPDQPGRGFEGNVVQFAEGPLGPVRNLTATPVEASSLLIQDGYVCWLEGDLARCYHWQDDTWLEATAVGTAIAASATHVATFESKQGQDFGSLSVRSWDAQPSSPIGTVEWTLVAAVVCVAVAWRRRQ